MLRPRRTRTRLFYPLVLVTALAGPAPAAAPPEAESPPAPEAPAEAALAETTEVDRIVAVVGDRLVLLSDIQVELTLAARSPSPLSVLRRRQAEPLDMLIDAAILRGLAGETSVYQPSAAEVRSRLDAFQATFTDPADLRRWLDQSGLDDERLRGLIYARLVVERYVQRNVGLPSEAANEGAEASFERYRLWVEGQRSEAAIRLVSARQPRTGAP